MTCPEDPVFPTENHAAILDGMTKREYFAAMAMQGLVAYTDNWKPDTVACMARQHADALIAELNKEP